MTKIFFSVIFFLSFIVVIAKGLPPVYFDCPQLYSKDHCDGICSCTWNVTCLNVGNDNCGNDILLPFIVICSLVVIFIVAFCVYCLCCKKNHDYKIIH